MEWLVTWLWQGVAVAWLVGCLLRASRSVSASTRYLLWWATLLAVLALPWANSAWRVGRAVRPETAALLDATAAPVLPVTLPPAPAWLIAAAIGVWVGVSAWRLARVAHAIGSLQQLKRACIPISATREAGLPLWLSVRDSGRTARLCVSGDVAVASMLGLGRPIIAVPQSLMAALSNEELDQIVLHEYAHVQRHDDWTRLAQTLIEAICGFHPAIWRIRRALNLEREVACDDWVINRCGVPRTYASCLTKIATIAPWRAAPTLAPGAVRSGGAISRRVERLLNEKRNVSLRPSAATLGVGAGFLAALVVLFGSLSPVAAVSNLEAGRPIVDATGRSVIELETSSDAELSSSLIVEDGSLRAAQPGPVASSNKALDADAAPGHAFDVPHAMQRNRHRLGDEVAIEPSPPPLIDARPVALQPRPALRGLPHVRPTLPATTGSNRDVPLGSSAELSNDVSRLLAGDDREAPVGQDAGPRAERDAIGDRSPWSRLAGAGVALGAEATKAAVATAGAFEKLGGSLKRVFSGQP